MRKANPFTASERRSNIEGLYQAEEVWLANRNSGLLLEALRHDVTPAGLHYLLSHFDVPYVADATWQVEVAGREVEAWAAEVAVQHGFSDVSHTIEIFGTCSRCRR